MHGIRRRICTGLCGWMLLVLCGCGEGTPDIPPPEGVGETPQATLAGFYYYRDRGDTEGLNTIVRGMNGAFLTAVLDQKLPAHLWKQRGLVIDHERIKETRATIFYRTWESDKVKARDGRPCIAELIKEGNRWYVDVPASTRQTFVITEGKTAAGFYDGSKRWWKTY